MAIQTADLIRKLFGVPAPAPGAVDDVPSMRQRLRWARSLEKAVEEARRPRPPLRLRPILQASVVRACEPALLAIAGALRDQRQPISNTALRQLKAFLTDGFNSPLYGYSPLAARSGAERLRLSFTGHPERI